MNRPVPKRLGGDTFRPIANDVVDDVSNVGSMGPIQPDVGRTPTRGAAPADHPELAASRRDAKLLKIADLANESSAGHDSSHPEALDAVAHGAFVPSAALTSGVVREKRHS